MWRQRWCFAPIWRRKVEQEVENAFSEMVSVATLWIVGGSLPPQFAWASIDGAPPMRPQGRGSPSSSDWDQAGLGRYPHAYGIVLRVLMGGAPTSDRHWVPRWLTKRWYRKFDYFLSSKVIFEDSSNHINTVKPNPFVRYLGETGRAWFG